MSFNLIFNLTDVGTTYLAMSTGFIEGNSLVLGVSAALGLNTLASLGLMKLPIVSFAIIAGLCGARSRDLGKRNLVVLSLLTSTLIFFVVSVNNIAWMIG